MSIKELQERTGFSHSTISRVLNGKAKEFRISESTCRTILESAEALNYRPNILARSLRLRKSMTIGLIVPDIQNPFFGELAWRIEKNLREHGYSTILCNTNEVPENEEFYLKVLLDRQVDGIIIAPIHTREWDELENIRKETQVVLIDRIFYETDIPYVTSGNKRAAEDITEALIEQGHRRIAYLGGTPDTYMNTMRFMGYESALRRNGIEREDAIIQNGGYSSEAGERMMTTLLERAPDLAAALCVNNLVFLGAMKVVQKHELAHPGRSILMAAFDIGRYCEIFKRPLLCASQDLPQLSESAVRLLMDAIEKQVNQNVHLTIPITIGRHRLT